MGNKNQKTNVHNLDSEEIELLESIENGEWKTTGNIEERRQILRSFFSNTTESKNHLTLNLRKEDYDTLMQKSSQYGMHYQELLEKLIHKFAQGKILL